MMLQVRNLNKSYPTGAGMLHVLQSISFQVSKGESLSIMGPSGSGKTTLLGLCAGLDTPSSGSVNLNGKDLGILSEDERAFVRNQYVGFIFQNFQLLPTLTALENVMIPLELKGGSNIMIKAKSWLDRVGLGERFNHYPAQLSGGEQQRVSLARAFMNDPLLVFADEPTGNLDDETGQSVEGLLFDLNKQASTTLVIVTHDRELALKTDRLITLKGGKLISDVRNSVASSPTL